MATAEQQLTQLKQAELLVQQDSSHYPTILPAVLALSAQRDITLRRWIANFLTNTFASKQLESQLKEDLATLSLDPLRTLIEGDDDLVLKNCILCSSLIYPILFRRICKNTSEGSLWGRLTLLKGKILRIWDGSVNEGVRIAGAKFITKVVATQTPGIKDPRLADKSDISSTIVPLNHPTIHLSALEAESQGLLDRLLAHILEKPIDPILAMAVINAVGPLVKTRHTLSSKIISAFLTVDITSIPQNATNPLKAQLQLRSVSKTLRIQLSHFLKTNAAGPLSNRIDQYLRTSQVNGIITDGEEFSRKRPAAEDSDSPSSKKLKAEDQVIVDPAVSAAFLLEMNNPLALFDAKQIPLNIAVEIIMKAMEILAPEFLEDRLNLVRARLLTLPSAPVLEPVSDTMNGEIDDYDPEASFNIADEDIPPQETEVEMEPAFNELAIQSFELPVPEPLSVKAIQEEFQASVDRILQSLRIMDKSIIHRAGVTSKAASLETMSITEWDKDTWMILLSRLSARGLHPPPSSEESTLLNVLRERLFDYIMINFREHMDLTIMWLTEEWYSDQLTGHTSYIKWATRIFDNIIPFIEAKDTRIFLRFLGDLPLLTTSHVQKLRILCLDPERLKLGFASIKYLLLLRPPAREAAIELCVDLWRNHADTRNAAAEILKRYAPMKMVEDE